MQFYLNGEKRKIEAVTNIQQLIETLRLNPKTVVVEHNHRVVKRDGFVETILSENDEIEIVQFVGGGSVG